MNWVCVKAEFVTHPEDWSVVHDVFDRHGCPGTVEHSDPPAMSAYSAGGGFAALGAALLDLGAERVSFEVVPDEDWSESWKQFFRPRPLGERFMIVPSWEEPFEHDREFIILLDPGQAFGTGEHATTAMCLAMLEMAVRPGDRVLDVGTGSGILAIAASMLGATVSATEVDPVAADAARDNFDRNRVLVELSVGAGVSGAGFDIVVSNIVSATLIRLSADMARCLKQDGLWIVSGIIVENWPDVEAAAARLGFHTEARAEETGWIAAMLRLSS